MKSKILITLGLILIILAGCRKEELIVEVNQLNARLEEIRSRLTPKEINFFDYGFAERNNPHIKPGELIQFRDGGEEEFVNSIIDKVLLDNAEFHFVGSVMDRIGYPIWNRSLLLQEETEGHHVGIIPFAKLSDSIARAYLISFRPADEWFFTLVEKTTLKSWLQTESSSFAEKQAKAFCVINFLILEDEIFRAKDEDLLTWLLAQPDLETPQLTSGSEIDFRCTLWFTRVGRCVKQNAMAITSGKNSIGFRSPCPEGRYFEGYVTHIEAGTDCFSGSSGGEAPPGFSFPGSPAPRWFSINDNHTGNGSGSNNSVVQSVFTHPYLGSVMQFCSLVEQAANGENGSNITFTQQELESCQQMTAIVSGLIVTPDHLAWLHQNNPGAFSAVASYLSSPGISALERQALAAYVALLASGKTSLPLRQFIPLYQLVYGQLVPALGLNAQEAEFLLLAGNGALANEIKQFLEEEGASLETHTAASFVFRAINQDVLEGPYTGTFQQLLNQYPDYASDPLMGLKVAIEAATLKLHHPEWSNFRLAATALLNVTLEQLHLQLDVLGLIPGAGEIADLVSGGIYTLEGDWFNAGLSFSASIPFAGWYATGAKLAMKAVGPGKKITLKYIRDQSTGLIQFGDRSQLRRVLQTPSGHQAHHIVPWGKTNHDVIQKAASAGSDKAFHPNEIFNGINLPTSRHSGDHPNYGNLIQQRLNAWQDAYPNATPEQAANSIRQWLQTLKSHIQTSTAHINDIVPPVIPFVP